MRAATWTRDSHGLFDYESSHILKKILTTHQTRILVRTSTGEIQLISEKQLPTLSQDTALLFKITPNTQAQGIYIYFYLILKHPVLLWRIVPKLIFTKNQTTNSGLF